MWRLLTYAMASMTPTMTLYPLRIHRFALHHRLRLDLAMSSLFISWVSISDRTLYKY